MARADFAGRNCPFMFYLDELEMATIREAAHERRVSMSELCRDTVLEALAEEEERAPASFTHAKAAFMLEVSRFMEAADVAAGAEE